MSQYPQYPQQPSPYPQVPNYSSGGGVPVNPRPGSVMSLSIIGIVIGSLSCLCIGPSLFLNAAMIGNGGRNPLAPQLPAADHAVVIFSVVQCVINLGSAIPLLICSIGALYLKPWARRVLMPWSWITLSWAVVLLVIELMWIGPATEKMLTQANPNAAMASAQHVGFIFGQVLTCAIMASLPVCFLIFWTKPRVKAAFGENPGGMLPYYAPPEYPYGQYPPTGGQ